MAFLDEVMVKQITEQAREIHFRRTLLTVFAAVLWGIGAGVYHAFRVAWLAVTWCFAAVRLGWRDARASHERRAKKH